MRSSGYDRAANSTHQYKLSIFSTSSAREDWPLAKISLPGESTLANRLTPAFERDKPPWKEPSRQHVRSKHTVQVSRRNVSAGERVACTYRESHRQNRPRAIARESSTLWISNAVPQCSLAAADLTQSARCRRLTGVSCCSQ